MPLRQHSASEIAWQFPGFGDHVSEVRVPEHCRVDAGCGGQQRRDTDHDEATVVIAHDTRRLLGSLFEFKDLGPREIKGIAEPMRAWAALRSSSVESRFEALRSSMLSPLVGRNEEIDILVRAREGRRRPGCAALR